MEALDRVRVCRIRIADDAEKKRRRERIHLPLFAQIVLHINVIEMARLSDTT